MWNETKQIEAPAPSFSLKFWLAKCLTMGALSISLFDISSTYYIEAKTHILAVTQTAALDEFRAIATRMGWEPKKPPLTKLQAKDIVIREAVADGVNPDLALALWQWESRGDQYAVSPVGAIGHMQIMPVNAVKLCGYKKSAELYDEEKNIKCGVRFFAELLRQYKWNVNRALRAYNGGGNCTEFGACKESEEHARGVLMLLAKNVAGENGAP